MEMRYDIVIIISLCLSNYSNYDFVFVQLHQDYTRPRAIAVHYVMVGLLNHLSYATVHKQTIFYCQRALNIVPSSPVYKYPRCFCSYSAVFSMKKNKIIRSNNRGKMRTCTRILCVCVRVGVIVQRRRLLRLRCTSWRLLCVCVCVCVCALCLPFW